MKLNIKPTVFTVCTKLSYNPDFVNKKITFEIADLRNDHNDWGGEVTVALIWRTASAALKEVFLQEGEKSGKFIGEVF